MPRVCDIMSSQCYIMNMNRVMTSNRSSEGQAKTSVPKEKVMSYEEKTVGSTPFFKCEACPYMALAEDDIKFHLFTEHPDLAKTNGLADNIQINCPGCASIFDAEETLRTHLRNHHKMGIKDVRKMVKSLVQIALKNAKLKKEDDKTEQPPPVAVSQEIPDVKIPQVIEIVPDIVNTNTESLPKGVAFISVDELHKMSTPNFEKVDPKEIIQEASINIVYTNEVSTQYLKVSNAESTTSCNVIQLSSVTPDLISSIQPLVPSVKDKTSLSPQMIDYKDPLPPVNIKGRPKGSKSFNYDDTDGDSDVVNIEKKLGKLCSVDNCHFRLKDDEKLAYHRKCHQNGKLHCPECSKVFVTLDVLHSHLWKAHAVDLELPTCEVCGYKTSKSYRLYNIHMKCHVKKKLYACSICSKKFESSAQWNKHKLTHNKELTPLLCSICKVEFNSQKRLKDHIAAVHEKLTHNKELNPPLCSICKVQFSSQKRLKGHIAAVHDKIKPFKCSYCDYTAARKQEIQRHLRSHSGDKPFSCDQCMYQTADHNALRRHKKFHANEVVYRCKYCPYTSIQSTRFTSHMISKHPNVNSNDLHRCPFCPFVSVNRDKYVTHLTTHPDKEGIPLLIEISNTAKTKPSWTIPSESTEKHTHNDKKENEQTKEVISSTDNTIDVDSYDCDNFSEGIPQDYSKNYTNATNDIQPENFDSQELVQDLSKDDNNSDCLISESSNDTMLERQYPPQHPIMSYDNTQSNLHGFLNTTVSLEQNLIQNDNVSSLVTSHASIQNNINSNIMNNFPIRLPPAPQISVRNNITLRPLDKIPLPITTKVTGPIIKPTQILPVPSSSNSPVNVTNELEGVPRKKPKISVKSNLILKGPDQENMFHSQQKMAFKRLEDNERYGLGGPVTFNNLITTQFMQLQPEPTLSESPSNIMPYPQENLCDSSTPPVDNRINDNSQIFAFNQQMNVNQITLLPPPQKIQTNDPSYIKLEATIKQNTQSPSLERMCNANLLNNQAITREYKASPPLEEIHKNMNEIKNEVKSDAYYNISISSNAANPPILDQYLIDNIIGEQYSGHMDLSSVVLPEASDDQQNDVIEIDDNSDDNKLLPRFDMNFPLESLYLMHDFHFLDNEPVANVEVGANEMNRIVTEVPIINQKESIDIPPEVAANEFANFIQGKKDPMMNTSVRLTTNKINVKNIELMKN